MSNYETKNENKKIIYGKLCAAAVVIAFAVFIFTIFLVSRLDTDKTVSERENRTLAAKPRWSVLTFLNGSYAEKYDSYVSDTFPFRDGFLDINAKLSGAFSKNAGNDDMVLVEKQDKDDFAGQNID